MPKLDLGYVYGFFDGEGCIIDRCTGPDALWHTLEIHVTQCQREVLDMHAKQFGGRVIVQRANDGVRAKRVNGFRRTVYRWRLTGYAAASFLRAGLSYFVVKKQDALAALKSWDSRKRTRVRMPNAYYAEIKAAGGKTRQGQMRRLELADTMAARKKWLIKHGHCPTLAYK